MLCVEIRWRVRITDADLSFDSQHKLYHKTTIVIVVNRENDLSLKTISGACQF